MPRRRMVPISEEIIDEAIRVGERLGIPYIVLIERVLSSVLKIMRYKGNIIDTILTLDALDDIKKLGGIVLPTSIVSQMFNNFDPKFFEVLCKEYNRIGMWFGELSRIKRETTIEEFKRAISLWLPASSIDVSVEGDEYKVIIGFIGQEPDVVSIARCIVEGLIRGYNLRASEMTIKDLFIVAKVRGFVEE